MVVKSLQFYFDYQSKYLNSMKCREISMGPSICTIESTLLCGRRMKSDEQDVILIPWMKIIVGHLYARLHCMYSALPACTVQYPKVTYTLPASRQTPEAGCNVTHAVGRK
jgi:hypothetical protein